jgi:hypothetical protein
MRTRARTAPSRARLDSRAAPPLHLHAAFDALLARGADAAAVPLEGSLDGTSAAAAAAPALAGLGVDAAAALAQLAARGVGA